MRQPQQAFGLRRLKPRKPFHPHGLKPSGFTDYFCKFADNSARLLNGKRLPERIEQLEIGRDALNSIDQSIRIHIDRALDKRV